jgi:hypothetical protein
MDDDVGDVEEGSDSEKKRKSSDGIDDKLVQVAKKKLTRKPSAKARSGEVFIT